MGPTHSEGISRTERDLGGTGGSSENVSSIFPAHLGPSKSAVVTGLNPHPSGSPLDSWVLGLIPSCPDSPRSLLAVWVQGLNPPPPKVFFKLCWPCRSGHSQLPFELPRSQEVTSIPIQRIIPSQTPAGAPSW